MSVNDDDDGRHAMHGRLSSMVAEARRQEELRRAEQWWALASTLPPAPERRRRRGRGRGRTRIYVATAPPVDVR
jgi:hypothetical protein